MSEEKMNEEKKCEKKECCCNVWKVILLALFIYTFALANYTAAKLGIFDMKSAINQPMEQNQNFKISEKYDKGQSFEKAQKTGKPMVVWFYVDWCGYCKRFAPVFAKVIKTKEFKDNFAAAFVNCEDPNNQKLMEEYRIEAYPTVFVVKPDGAKVQVDNPKLFTPDADKTLIKEFSQAAGVNGESK